MNKIAMIVIALGLMPMLAVTRTAYGQETHEEQLTPEQKAANAKAQQAQPPEEEIAPELMDAASKLANQECALCHGRGGQSISPTFPRLAGQQEPYIETQLEAFKAQTRKDPDAQAFMWGMASRLTEPMMEALGRYYSMQKPVAPTPGDPNLVAAGKTIFQQGIPGQNVPACQTCHLAKAQGAAQFPRLAGQHVAYLVKQMRSFKSGLRASPIMEPIMHGFTSDQMKAVATYLGSLP